MFELAPADREILLHQGISRRLANRLAAWRAEKIALTATVLEAAAPGSALEKLLLAKTLLARDNFSENFQSLSQSPEFSSAQIDFDLAVTALDTWLIIASADEIIAEKSAENSPPPAATPTASALPTIPPPPDSPSFLPQLSPLNFSAETARDFSPIQPNNTPVFTSDAERLRVQIFTAAAVADRISALRQFAFAALDFDQKLPVFLQALGEDNGELRIAAAKVIAKFGVEPQFADTLAALASKRELQLTVERLRDQACAAAALAQTAAVMTIIGCVKDPQWQPAEISAVLALLTTLLEKIDLPLFASPDLWRILQTQMLAATAGEPFRAVFTALAEKNPALGAHFREEILRSNSAAYRGRLFALIAGWEINAESRRELLPSAVQTFAELPTTAENSFSARKFIGDCGDDGLLALNAQLLSFDVAHQRAAVRFLDNQSREKPLLLPLAETARTLFANSPLALRVDLLETQLCLRGDLPENLRRATAEILVRDYADYLPLSATYANALTRLRSPSPLLTALRREKNADAAALFAATLGKIGSADLPLAEEILRELAKLNFAGGAANEPAALAMSAIAGVREIPSALNSFTRRVLVERLRAREDSANLLIAVSQTLRGNFPDNDETAEAAQFVTNLSFRHLSSPNRADGIASSVIDGETVFSFDADADLYAELVPAAIAALQNTAIGYAPARAQIISQLLKLAAQPEFIAVTWGLANETKLLSALGKIGASPDCAADERERIAILLARRVEQTAALTALAEILQNQLDSPLFDRLAASLIARLLKLFKREKNIEARETYLQILTAALRRGKFSAPRGGGNEDLLAPAAELYLAAIREGVSGAWKQLQTLLAGKAFGETALAERLKREIAARSAVAAKSP